MADLKNESVVDKKPKDLENGQNSVDTAENQGLITPKEEETPLISQNNEKGLDTAVTEEETTPETAIEPTPTKIEEKPAEIIGVTPPKTVVEEEIIKEQPKEEVKEQKIEKTEKEEAPITEREKQALDNFVGQLQSGTMTNSRFAEYARANPQLVNDFKAQYVSFNKTKRINDGASKFANYTPSQLYDAVQNGDIVKGDDVWNRLPEQLRENYNSYESVQDDKNVTVNFKNSNQDRHDKILSLQDYVNALSEVFDTGSSDKINDLLNSPDIKASRDRVNNSFKKLDELDAQLDAIEDEVKKEYPQATGSKIAAIVANRQKPLLNKKKVQYGQYQTELANYNRIKGDIGDEVNAIKADDVIKRQTYMTALNLYQTQRKEMREDQINEFERQNEEIARKRNIDDQKNFILWKNKIANKEVSGQWKQLGDGLYFLKDDGTQTKVLSGTQISGYTTGELTNTNYKNDDGTFTSITFDKKSGQHIIKTFDTKGNEVFKGASSEEGDDFSNLAPKYPGQAWASNNNPAGLTYSPTALQRFINAGIDVTIGGDRPEAEGGKYFKFASIQDGFKAYENTWNLPLYQNKTLRDALNTWGTGNLPLDDSVLNKKVSDLTSDEQKSLLIEQIKKESPGLYKEMNNRGWIAPDDLNIPAKSKPVTVKETKQLSNIKLNQAQSIKQKNFENTAVVKSFIKASDDYDKLITALQRNSGPGDIAAIFGFMKSLDPSSVVREGEFQQAAESAGIVQGWQNIFNKANSGERLTETQRKEFGEISKQFILNSAKKVNEKYNKTIAILEAQIPGIDDVFFPDNPASRYLEEFEKDLDKPAEDTTIITHKGKKYSIDDYKRKVVDGYKSGKITIDQAKQMLKQYNITY